MIGLFLQTAFVVIRSQVGDPFHVYPARFWALVSPAGDRTFATSLGSDGGCHALSLFRYSGRVFDQHTEHAMRGRWTAIPMTSNEFSSLRVVYVGDRSWDDFLANRLTVQHERTPKSQFPNWTRADRLSDEADPASFYSTKTRVAGEIAYGWPFPAAAFAWQDVSGTAVFADSIAARYSASRPLAGRIPTRIYWPGTLANVFLGGAVVMSLTFALVMTKRAFRRRLGRCPECNYDLRHNTTNTCPECGSICDSRAEAQAK